MKNLTCIVCPNGCEMSVEETNGEYIVKGNMCPRGKEFAIHEMTNPTRSICTTVKTIYSHIPRLPVRTDGEIALKNIFPLMKLINSIVLDHYVHINDVVIENALDTGINVIATSDMYYLDGGAKNG